MVLLACCCVQVQLQDIPSMKDFMAAVTDTKEVRRFYMLLWLQLQSLPALALVNMLWEDTSQPQNAHRGIASKLQWHHDPRPAGG
jgi:hypothetical protein